MIKTTCILGVLALSVTACQNQQTSTSNVLATETVVNEPLTSNEIKQNLCKLIKSEYYQQSWVSYPCDKLEANIVKKFESNNVLTMIDIKAKDERFSCTARATLVLAGQYVDQNGDIVSTLSSWKTDLKECSPLNLGAHLESIADGANIGNGDSAVVQYDMQTFKYIDAVNAIESSLENQNDADSCKFVTTRSTQGSLDDLNNLNTDDKSSEELQKLKDQGKIKHIISRQWDGNSGDSEYCSYYYFSIYTNEGQLLYLNYDYTT
jgi:hypothetical protein